MGHAQNFTVRLDPNVLPIARDRVEARLHVQAGIFRGEDYFTSSILTV